MIRRSFLVALTLCLVLSACGGAERPVSSLPESGQSEPAPLAASDRPEPASAPAPAGGESSSLPDPESGSGSDSREDQETPEADPRAPEEPGADSSEAASLPVEPDSGGEGEASRPEEPSSGGEESKPEPSTVPEPSGGGEEPSSQDPAPEESQPEPCPEPPSVPEGPEPLPEGCRWMNITEVSVLGFINRERGKRGLTPLSLDGDLTAAARLRAEELYRGNYVAHTRPRGEPWETVLGEIPVDYARAAENLAWCNHGTGEEIGAFQWFELWRDSPSHYKAMTDEMYTHCGVAVLTGPYYDGEDQSYAVAVFCTY